MIYYGDEIALRGHGDPDNRRDFPGGWAEDQRNAFTAAGRTTNEEQVHAHVKKLLALRHELEPLRRGQLLQLTNTATTAAFARATKDSGVIIALNDGDKRRPFAPP